MIKGYSLGFAIQHIPGWKTPQGSKYWRKWSSYLSRYGVYSPHKLCKGGVGTCILNSNLPKELHEEFYYALIETGLYGERNEFFDPFNR